MSATSAKTTAAALSTQEAAAYSSIARATLKKWRATGDGPPYVRVGTKIVYLKEDLDEFLTSHRVA